MKKKTLISCFLLSFAFGCKKQRTPKAASPQRVAKAGKKETLVWKELDFTAQQDRVTQRDSLQIYFSVPLSKTMKEIESEFAKIPLASGWRLVDREQGKNDDDREVLSDPEIPDEIKEDWSKHADHKVTLDFERKSDELFLYIRREDEEWNISFMHLPNAEEARQSLDDAMPCIRYRFCCRATEGCDFSRAKTITQSDICERELADLLLTFASSKREKPMQCEFDE